MWVEKAQVPVILFTQFQRIEAYMYTYKDARILDELNAGAKDYIALTNVKVYSIEGKKPMYEVDFMAINKKHIVNLMPQGEFSEKELF
ncbi:MAG: hypothetical protein AB1422_19485 [bacterium]